ncbi:hypothetical protein [Pseudoalteromonas distincta]|uniref:hypothetical protein n=1 Tax=Pseudoalteromonas distincta TaxID=77608 RepID=UPI00165F6D41|nr:hypothetical protein [Pseudoalteromonas distincta]MBD0412822.1 hypothetical protein [Pseudoalteromonas distincta]
MTKLLIFVFAIYTFCCSFVQAEALVNNEFVVPIEKHFENFTLVKVNPKYTKLDYKALMSAREFIQISLGTTWPADDFTLQENTQTLESDLIAFNNKESFTFHVMNNDKTKVIGCIYITGTVDSEFDANVFSWVAKEHLATPLFDELRTNVKTWVKNEWPFTNVDYPFNS